MAINAGGGCRDDDEEDDEGDDSGVDDGDGDVAETAVALGMRNMSFGFDMLFVKSNPSTRKGVEMTKCGQLKARVHPSTSMGGTAEWIPSSRSLSLIFAILLLDAADCCCCSW